MIADIKPGDEALPDGSTAVSLDGYRFAVQMDSMEENMTGATLLIKRMPPELKLWLAGEAERNHRSMNKEAIRLLEEARTLRAKAFKPARDTPRPWQASCKPSAPCRCWMRDR